MRADASQVAELAVDMAGAGDRAAVQADHVLTVAGDRIRDRARELIRGQIRGVFLPHYPDSITADTERFVGAVEVEVGPQVDRLQGGMGPGVEFGSANAGPLPHLFPAFEEVEGSVRDELAQLGAREAL